ncbi:hypothetical protein AKJ09_05407 [Labilithrix luteola]|uniref:Uncharacterized protein n=1 Tax=Labilithrix luteola TaxID=1391654 RepID=A0A0K1PZ01_9BACT|nr:hypothetical protein AKJ09_05407 [Labilithrix luteola]
MTATNAGCEELGDDASRFFQYCSRCVETSFRRANPAAVSAVAASSASAARASLRTSSAEGIRSFSAAPSRGPSAPPARSSSTTKRRAYGYRSFSNYRLRLLNACAEADLKTPPTIQ